MKIIETDGDTIDAPEYTPVWIKNNTNYWSFTGFSTGPDNGFEIMLKWTNGIPPEEWPGTLASGYYYVSGCISISGTEYTGDSSQFYWSSGSTMNVNVGTFYLRH